VFILLFLLWNSTTIKQYLHSDCAVALAMFCATRGQKTVKACRYYLAKFKIIKKLYMNVSNTFNYSFFTLVFSSIKLEIFDLMFLFTNTMFSYVC